MNHMTTSETYYCDECGGRHSSDCGNPLNQSEDERDLCERCFELRELKCDGCGAQHHHEQLELDTNINERFCPACVAEYKEHEAV